jgi:hypothetical protein
MSTAILAPTLTFKSWRNDGTPNAGGTLQSYAAGSTTPIVTYTDSTAGTTNANPITLNSRGEANLWLLPNVAYKFVEYDSAGTLLKTTDQVTQQQLLSLYAGVDTGVVNAYILAYNAPYSTYQDGIAIYWTPSQTNTTASTVNVSFNGGASFAGIKNIINQDGSALSAGQIVSGQISFIIYQSGHFVLTTPFGAGGNVSVFGVNVTGTSVPANGIYLPAANTLGFSSNTILHGQVNAAGQWQFYEALNAINALKNAATYETGSFTGTLTGCTTAPTATVNWSRSGNMICMEVPALNAVSNSVGCTITGVPATLTPARTQSSAVKVQDNSVSQMGIAIISGVVITLGKGDGTTFAAANNKGSLGGNLVYNLT